MNSLRHILRNLLGNMLFVYTRFSCFPFILFCLGYGGSGYWDSRMLGRAVSLVVEGRPDALMHMLCFHFLRYRGIKRHDFPFCSASYASLLLLWYSYASVCFCDFCCPLWIQASIGDTLAAPAAALAMFPRRKSRKSTVPCHCRYWKWMRRPRMKFQKMMELLHLHLCWNLRSP